MKRKNLLIVGLLFATMLFTSCGGPTATPVATSVPATASPASTNTLTAPATSTSTTAPTRYFRSNDYLHAGAVCCQLSCRNVLRCRNKSMHSCADTDSQALQVVSLQLCALFWQAKFDFLPGHMYLRTLSVDKYDLGTTGQTCNVET